jgi:hypothetical protein
VGMDDIAIRLRAVLDEQEQAIAAWLAQDDERATTNRTPSCSGQLPHCCSGIPTSHGR